MKLSDYLNSINYTKSDLFDTEDHTVEKEYVPFVVNRCLSYFPDTILYVNQMNQYCSLDKNMQFDYLRLSIRKRKRFSKWLKRESVEDLDLIKEYFSYSDVKAREALNILTPEDIDKIRQNSYRGGKKPI
tara:strand:+ start:2738 stop:3127 length:390 start_codon:yes stop_codon:yes gene_type:complete